jgi:S1-C subfamily serine protease
VKAPKPETPERAPAGGASDAAPVQKPWLGVELSPVSADVADYLELDGDAFQVVRVLDDTPAAKRGMKPRDILLEVNGKAIHAFDDVLKALDGADPNAVKIAVLRRGQRKEL